MKQLIIFPTPLDAHSELRPDDSGAVIVGVPATHPTGRPGQGFLLPEDTPNGHGATLTITAPKKAPLVQRGTLFLNDGLAYPWTAGQTAAFAADDFVLSSASSPSLPLEALHLQGRQGFHTPSGAHVPLTSVTGFRLVHLVATGQQDAARAFLAAIAPARCVRVLVMAKHLFELSPTAGIDALPATLKIAEECGRYLSVVALADSKSYSFDFERHVAAVGRAGAASKACVFVEIGNELDPLHSTQHGQLGDLDYLKRLRALIPAPVAVSLGSTHDGEDESDIFQDGDLLTIHGSRDDGDDVSGQGFWRWVRHTNEQRAKADSLRKYVVNDEPKRDDLRADKHLAMALLCRLFRIADTFHYAGGRQCLAPAGDELTAFQARARGWAAIPDDWFGEYANTGATIPRSPVKSFAGAVRIYSSVNGGQAYSLVLGASSGLQIEWSEEWGKRERVIAEGGCQLWKVSR